MTILLANAYRALLTWIYYRVGWVRASLFGIRVEWSARVSPHAKLRGMRSIGTAVIGRDVVVGVGTYTSSGIIQCARIGSYCSIGPEVLIGPTEHRLDHWTTSPYESQEAGEPRGVSDKPPTATKIGDGVWIGAKVIVLQGVSIGNRAVIAAGAVVVHDVPPNELWGGVPAKKIRYLSAYPKYPKHRGMEKS